MLLHGRGAKTVKEYLEKIVLQKVVKTTDEYHKTGNQSATRGKGASPN